MASLFGWKFSVVPAAVRKSANYSTPIGDFRTEKDGKSAATTIEHVRNSVVPLFRPELKCFCVTYLSVVVYFVCFFFHIVIRWVKINRQTGSLWTQLAIGALEIACSRLAHYLRSIHWAWWAIWATIRMAAEITTIRRPREPSNAEGLCIFLCVCHQHQLANSCCADCFFFFIVGHFFLFTKCMRMCWWSKMTVTHTMWSHRLANNNNNNNSKKS